MLWHCWRGMPARATSCNTTTQTGEPLFEEPSASGRRMAAVGRDGISVGIYDIRSARPRSTPCRQCRNCRKVEESHVPIVRMRAHGARISHPIPRGIFRKIVTIC